MFVKIHLGGYSWTSGVESFVNVASRGTLYIESGTITTTVYSGSNSYVINNNGFLSLRNVDVKGIYYDYYYGGETLGAVYNGVSGTMYAHNSNFSVDVFNSGEMNLMDVNVIMNYIIDSFVFIINNSQN